MSRPRHYAQAAQRKRTPPSEIAPEQDDDDLEWYDEPEQEQTQEKPE